MAGLLWVIYYATQNKLAITWWQWVLTGLGFIYVTFTLEVIIAFLAEGATQGALAMGGILLVVAVVFGVLMGRFVFRTSES